jgi:hypothetical protein
MMVSLHAKRRLERLADCYGLTQRSLIEEILADAERAALDSLPAEQQEAYYDRRLTSLRRNEYPRSTQAQSRAA